MEKTTLVLTGGARGTPWDGAPASSAGPGEERRVTRENSTRKSKSSHGERSRLASGTNRRQK